MFSLSLSIIFFIIATIYSSIGFGGGSSYIALMLIYKIPFEQIPIIALSCNLIVVSGNLLQNYRNKYLPVRKVLPFALASIPAAYIGGMIDIPKDIFKILLGLSLLFASLRMIFKSKEFSSPSSSISSPNILISLGTGLILGFLSGVVGIGGGIFLSPLMYNLRWGRPKEIAVICSLFIFLNSIAGLIGQIQKDSTPTSFESHYLLFIAVLVGGQIGSFLGVFKFNPRIVQILTSVLILVVSLRVLFISQ